MPRWLLPLLGLGAVVYLVFAGGSDSKPAGTKTPPKEPRGSADPGAPDLFVMFATRDESAARATLEDNLGPNAVDVAYSIVGSNFTSDGAHLVLWLHVDDPQSVASWLNGADGVVSVDWSF